MAAPPAPSPRRPVWKRWLDPVRPALEAAAIGAALGGLDAHLADSGTGILFLYGVFGFVEGFRHAGRAWQCWLPLGSSMYLAHVAAIGCGYRPPYVEPDAIAARQGLIYFYPASFGLITGAGVRFLLAAFGAFPREEGPPVRLIPRSIRELFATVAGVAVFLFAMRWLAADATTVYAPGFSERRFAEVRVGDTTGQVRARLGPPLEQVRVGEMAGRVRARLGPLEQQDRMPNVKLWVYSLGAAPTSNYKRYWVIIEGDKVAGFVDDYWWDD